MKKNLIIVVFCALTIGLYAQTEVKQFIPGVTSEGITYYLPKTAIRIAITAERTTVYPGEFKDYAQRYLKLANVTQAEETVWQIREVKLTPYGIPDSSKVFTIPLRKKTVAPLVGLTSDGIITSINVENQDEPLKEENPAPVVKKSSLNPRDYLTEEILQAGSKMKMAELIASEVYDIRESRNLLSKGQADYMPKDGAQLQLMMQRLDTQEEALLQLFKGTEEKETRIYTLGYIPQKEVSQEIAFRFSKELGLVDKNNLAGAPVYVDVTDKKTVPAEVVDPKQKKLNEESVRYCIPSQVTLKLYDRNQTYAEITTPLAQFGRIEYLSSELFNKRQTTHVTFYPTTGAIKRVTDANIME